MGQEVDVKKEETSCQKGSKVKKSFQGLAGRRQKFQAEAAGILLCIFLRCEKCISPASGGV